MTRHTRALGPNSIAAIIGGLALISVLGLATAWASTEEAGAIDPIRVAPSAMEIVLRARNDSPSTLDAVLPVLLQLR
jgi:hypothetical protein